MIQFSTLRPIQYSFLCLGIMTGIAYASLPATLSKVSPAEPERNSLRSAKVDSLENEDVTTGAPSTSHLWNPIATGQAFNVRTFGASPNSSASVNLAAINHTIQAASKVMGSTVYIPAGTYPISGSILVRSNVEIYGDGPTTILKCIGGDYIGIVNVDTAKGNSGITIRDFCLDGQRGARRNGAGIRIIASDANSCQDVHLAGLTLQNIPYTAVQLMNVQQASVKNCTINQTSRDGITVWFNSQQVTIEGNHISNTRDDCIALNSEAPGHVGTKTRSVTITNNNGRQASDSALGTGIRIAGADDVTASQNTIEYAQGWGIVVEGGLQSKAKNSSNRVEVTDNTVQKSGTVLSRCGGIAVTAATQEVTVQGNSVENYYGNGIQCLGKAVVTNNSVGTGETPSSIGIFVDAPACTITGNTITKSASHGILVGADNVTISGNTIEDAGQINKGATYILINGDAKAVKVTGNTIVRKTSGANGIRITAGKSQDCVISDNRAQGFSAATAFTDANPGAASVNSFKNNMALSGPK